MLQQLRRVHERGTFPTLRTCCPAKHTHWHCRDSQPYIKRRAVGEQLLSWLVSFTGASPTRTLRLWRFMNIQVIYRKSFFNYQWAILIPAVEQPIMMLSDDLNLMCYCTRMQLTQLDVQ